MTMLDRCDRCKAQAFVRVTMESGELTLCGHHYGKHHKVLNQQALFVYEELEKLRKGE